MVSDKQYVPIFPFLPLIISPDKVMAFPPLDYYLVNSKDLICLIFL